MDGEAGKSEFLGDGGLQGLAAVINKTYTKTVICKFAVRLALGGAVSREGIPFLGKKRSA